MAWKKKSYVANNERLDVYEKITNRVIAQLKLGVIPWFRPWQDASGTACSFIGSTRPENAKTGHVYQGLNVLMLWLTAAEKGYKSNKWMTYDQCKALGGYVLKGEESTVVFLMKNNATGKKENKETGETEEFTYRFAKHFNVFNSEQTSIADKFAPQQQNESTVIVPQQSWECRPEIDSWVEATEIKIVHGGNKACYSPGADRIRMPHRAQFRDKHANYYATLFHEIGHATGESSRCGRTFGLKGTQTYAKEELVAELVSAFLCADHGVIGEPSQTGELGQLQHASYIDYWLKQLGDDKKFIFNAATNAKNACLWLHGKVNESEEQEEQEAEFAHAA